MLVQTQEDFSDFAIVMEEFYAAHFGDSAPRIMDISLVCSVYCSSSMTLMSDGMAATELTFAILALEKAGRPPLKVPQPFGIF